MTADKCGFCGRVGDGYDYFAGVRWPCVYSPCPLIQRGGEMTDLRGVKLLVLDFDGCLSSGTVYVMPDGSEAVRCSRLDGIGLARLRALGIPAVVISSEPNAVVKTRCDKLRVTCYHGVEDKRAVLRALADNAGIALADVAYLGNDINDLACLRAVGHPFVVRDAHDSVLGHGFTKLRRRGGDGAVRELCDAIADAVQAGPRVRDLVPLIEGAWL